MKYNLKNFSYYTYRLTRTLPYVTFFSCMPLHSTAQTAQPIYTHDSSNDAVSFKEVPFGGRIDTKLHLGVNIPENSKFWNQNAKFAAK